MGVMGAIAVCLASALPLAKAAEEGPESLITAPIQALEENNPKAHLGHAAGELPKRSQRIGADICQ